MVDIFSNLCLNEREFVHYNVNNRGGQMTEITETSLRAAAQDMQRIRELVRGNALLDEPSQLAILRRLDAEIQESRIRRGASALQREKQQAHEAACAHASATHACKNCQAEAESEGGSCLQNHVRVVSCPGCSGKWDIHCPFPIDLRLLRKPATGGCPHDKVRQGLVIAPDGIMMLWRACKQCGANNASAADIWHGDKEVEEMPGVYRQ
jgi:hypothetical protein